MDSCKVYKVLYGSDASPDIVSKGWQLHDQVCYVSRDEAEDRMKELKKQNPDREWAVEEAIGLAPGIIIART